MVKGMEFAVEHGCDVISMSMGTAQAEVPERTLLRHACEALLEAGIVAVFPAGNEHNLQHLCPIPYNVRVPGSCPPPYLDPDQMVNPGGLSCAICVGSVDENDSVASSSSEGPATWQDTEFGDYAYDPGMGLIRPDVCAPGVIIWSLDYQHIYDYDYKSGTSQATPCVAGIVALMLYENPELTPEAICQILEETSLRLTPTKSNRTGVGRVDALAAVTAAAEWDGIIQTTIESVALYPNPVEDVLYLDVAEGTPVTVFDMTGSVVKQERYEGPLDVSRLAQGVYTIQVDGLTVKFVKK